MKYIYKCAFVILMFFACKKKDDNNGHYNPCGKDIKNVYITSGDLLKIQFKTGTYWIFKDSVTDTTDSTYVKKFDEGVLYDGCNTNFQYHSFATISSLNSKWTDYIIIEGGLYKGFSGTIYSGNNIYEGYNIQSPRINHGLIMHDSLFIYDRYYQKVSELEIDNDQTEGKKRCIYFINSEYGFLRIDIYQNNQLQSKLLLQRKKITR